MEEWEEIVGEQAFISDLGESRTVSIDGVATIMGRYAVWSPLKERPGHRVIEVGDNLQVLQKKYQISETLVLSLVTREVSSHA